MKHTEAINTVEALLDAHPTLNLAALRAWRDAHAAPVTLADLRSGRYGSYSVLLPRIKYLIAYGYLTSTEGFVRATGKSLLP